jgi:signal transduction histidine kinase
MAPSRPGPEQVRHNRMVLLILGTSVAFGLHLGLVHALFWRSLWGLWIFLVGSIFYSGIGYVLWRWVYPRCPGRNLGMQILSQALVSTAIFSVWSFLAVEGATRFMGFPSPFGAATGAELQRTVTPAMLQRGARLYVLLPIVPTVLLTLIGYHQSWRRIRTLETRERELTELAATAQLAALRAQINPHFLFNSLNSIAQLIHADPDAAESCVERLAQMFRYVLTRADKEFVPLAEELDMARAYLDIERARFGDRLRVDTRVEPLSLRQLIPNLILQPLVENAVKHGLSPKRGPGTVRIEARVDGGHLTLTVGDDGLGMAAPALARVYEGGVGLRNLRARLERLYGPAHLPEITSQPGGGTQVRLTLPLRSVEAAA